ncbi:putative ubiquitinyl hydrolase 1 [Lupinus albus]|uniref:Putative ubiquitinyl hydrolase 1 n=1 Tax=Lupinus albus TaxID=3870 RepID=A0A6A4QU09_LUPAL|nr:putative ubiquitinyl hydrolase 1 [Lupinus albus]
MLVYVSSSPLQLNWLFGLLGLAEKKATISDDSSNINHPCLILLLILLTILIGIGLYFNHLAEYNNNSSEDHEVDQSLKEGEHEHPGGELDHYFDGGQQLSHPTATRRGFVRRYGACTFCGNLSSRRCSRCKVARYCSVECQIRHWRSGHKHECFETETKADEAKPIHANKSEGETTSNEVKLGSDMGEVDVSSDSDFNNLHCSCEVCGSPSTTRCTICKTVTYCSTKCLIEDWKWHKVNCTAGEVNLTPTENFHGDVGVLKNSREEEENVHSSGTLYLHFYLCLFPLPTRT